jgi:hypothetical protein
MSFSRPLQWYHSHADPIWPDGNFNNPPPPYSQLLSHAGGIRKKHAKTTLHWSPSSSMVSTITASQAQRQQFFLSYVWYVNCRRRLAYGSQRVLNDK